MRGGSTKAEFIRLPSTVTPVNYDITLRPNLKSFTFSGSQAVRVVVNEKTKQIVLNTNEIDISVASYTPENGKTLSSEKIENNAETEVTSIEFAETLIAGPGVLKLEFTGTLNDKLKGFYRSKYMSPDGQEERYAAVTQFEATDARRAFPCWDEPALKATFDITLVVPTNRVALSNMNVTSESVLKDDPSLKEVKYATTPVMSTYLVAFVVGEYDYVEGKSEDGVDVRVYTPLGKKDQGLFALEVAVKTLPYYKDYFNIPYPLPKMDLIALADFASGAMENWGLVTYRETCLLVDPQNTSTRTKQYVALVVAHELAHQWFGNLVTMEWWTHLWLNEGFASFVEYLCVDHLFSEYHIWTQFVSDTFTPALELDALHNSHPIEVPVGHPSEIDEIFDNISYNKGSAVIRMLHRFIGDELFRKGMHSYLSKHSYKNTLTEDLWASLQEASNKPVRDVMTTWTKQKGYPVISVTSRRDGNSLILTLTQNKFCADGKLPASEANTLWMIPISVTRASDPTKIAVEVLMDTKTIDIEIPDVSANEWIKLNPNCVGVYRVHYSQELLNLLLPAVANKTLPPLDRLGLQNDLFALVKSGQTSTVDILKLMDSFANEDDYTVYEDLWASLQEASNKPVRDVMTTWTKQKGYPVISVTSRRDGNSLILTLTQNKFCADGKLPASEANTLWMIPISVTRASDPTKIAVEVLMDTKTIDIEIPNVSANEWIKLNPNCVGVYRVHYSQELLNLLLPAVANKTLPPLDRLGLQNDLFALVKSGQTSTVDILKLMDSFANEDDYTVWTSIIDCLGRLNQLLSHTDVETIFHEFGRQLLSKTYSRLGWEPIKGETHMDTLLRSLVITRLASFEDPIVLSEAKKMFDSHCGGTYTIAADIRGSVYRAVALDCNDKSFETLFKLYREAELHEEKDRVSRALGAVKDANRIAKVLDFALSSEVRNQDSVFVIISVALTKNGRDIAWEFFKKNKDELRRRYEGGFMVTALVKHISQNFVTEERLQEVETFFTQNPFPGSERTVQQSLETIRLNIDWLARDLPSIQSYLTKRS
ncbi:unnamed protein product [Medioppia subpectinata]|uniref:Puromycin-sensitive aminopeptidase n=1 Tax=Medioppia subpectinata TaxID=1979941 RepID=A0A7R9PXR4_9ACAR|nr:unnamed protein product [Medioppia subpectinata]CAG2104297.1 unnamed protein product [Medioppia subpectinata]